MVNPPKTYEFVISDPISNPKPGTSLKIRSRCMQGRNKRDGSRRTQREKKRAVKECGEIIYPQRVRGPVKQIVSSNMPPRSLINDLALMRLTSISIDFRNRGMLFKTFAYNFANEATSPLDHCVAFESIDSVTFDSLFADAAFVHSVLCASYAINDFLDPHWNGKPGRIPLFHLHKTLSLLQAKMRDGHCYEDESVLQVVINIGLLAAAYGEWGAAAEHLKGLHKIVQLRGGLEFLRTRPKLHFKLDR